MTPLYVAHSRHVGTLLDRDRMYDWWCCASGFAILKFWVCMTETFAAVVGVYAVLVNLQHYPHASLSLIPDQLQSRYLNRDR